MWFFGFWIASIVITLIVAEQKGLSKWGYFFLALFTGPLAVIIALLSAPEKKQPDELAEIRQRVGDLQRVVYQLEAKVARLETRVDREAPIAADSVSVTVAPPVPSERLDDLAVTLTPQEAARDYERERAAAAIPPSTVETMSHPPLAEPRDIELDFGRNWLSKIGVVVLALGVGFLISYTFKYFGPLLKIAFGYAASAGLFIAGFRLEKKAKFVSFGRALLGGAWALAYFTTYAMHHFEASRLIDSQVLDAVLLAFVVGGMVFHVARYKSESMMAVALFVAYITATMGKVTGFTVFSCVLLGALAVFLIYRFQWVRTFILAVVMTYGIHYAWVVPNIAGTLAPTGMPWAGSNPREFLNLILLGIYWLVFLVGVHLVKMVRDDMQERIVAGTNFGNISLFGVLAYPLILNLFYGQRFAWVLGAGILYLVLALWMKQAGREKLYRSDIVAAVFCVTSAISLRFLPSTSLLLWLVEVPCLLFVGIAFKDRIYRYLSYALAVFVAFRMLFMGAFSEKLGSIAVLSWAIAWTDFLCLWASVSMAVCFVLLYRSKEEIASDTVDMGFEYFFSTLACLYFVTFVAAQVSALWLAFALAAEALALFLVGMFSGLGRFRAYAYLVLFWLLGVFIASPLDGASTDVKWFIAICDVAVFFVIYAVVKQLRKAGRFKEFVGNEAVFLFGGGIIMLVAAFFLHVQPQWISLCLGIASAAFILTGITGGDKTERMGGLALLALTLGRVVFVDLSGLDIIFKIITFIALGVLFLGASYFYNRFSAGEKG